MTLEQQHICNIYECLLGVKCKGRDDLYRGYREFIQEIENNE